MRLTCCRPAPGWDENEVLALAAALESRSEHPLAAAIMAAAAQRSLILPEVAAVTARPGLGLTGRWRGQEVFLGNRRFFEEMELGGGALMLSLPADLMSSGASVVLIGYAKQTIGWLELVDELRPSAGPALAELAAMGMKLVLLSGDRRETVAALARQFDFSRIEAELLPADKTEVIRQMQQNGAVVAMVGDGINDAPALAAADLGIAIGAGSDIAHEAGDVTLVGDDLRLVGAAFRLSRATLRVIRQNLFWAFFYDAVGIPQAAGVLAPWGIELNPMIAAAAMALSSVSVVGNSLRLRKIRLLDRLDW